MAAEFAWRNMKDEQGDESSAPGADGEGRPVPGDPSVAGYPTEELIFSDFFRALRRQIVLISCLTVGGGLLAAVLSYFITPRYEATAVMMAVEASNLSSVLGDVSPALGGLIGAAGFDVGSQSKEREAVAILQSRAFAISFIERENALPVIFPELWDSERRVWLTKSGAAPSPNSAYKRFNHGIRTIRRNTETGLIQLAIRLPNRVLAAEWANKLAAQLNEELRRRVITEAQASLNFLNNELDKTAVVGIREAIFKLVEAQTKEIMLAKVREQYALRITDPAAAADEDDPVFPKPAVLAVLGALSGLLLGIVIALFWRRPGSAARTGRSAHA